MRRLLVTVLSLVLCLSVAPTVPSSAAAQSADSPWYDWKGEAAMISNQGLYRSNEFIYQDYIYDDHGANTDGIDHTDAPFGGGPNPQDPADPRLGSSGGQIRHAGDFFYASDSDGYYHNVADLIEFRVAETDGAVHYLFRLGALDAPDSAAIGMCVDTDQRAETGLVTWPFDAGLSQALGCDQFYTVFGTGAAVTDASGASTDLRELGGDVRADVEANTIELRVPKALADPAGATWRYYIGSGVWDAEAGTWLQVPPTPSMPGQPVATGGGVDAPQIWDLLSNNSEPNTYWREEKQANDLIAQGIEEHYVDVRFPRLDSALDDPEPQLTGVVDRIYVSDFTLDPSEGITAEAVSLGPRNYVYWGRYQPYAVVVPSTYWQQRETDPDTRLPFDLCLHPLNGNHHVEIYYAEAEARRTYVPGVSGTTPQTGDFGFDEFENRIDRQNLVYACVNGRGEAVGYTGGIGLTDALEVYADVQEHYAIDVDKRTLHGISLGAIGTWYTAALYPDRFSAALPSIFSPGFSCNTPTLANYYNLPIFYTIGTGDEFGQGAFGDCVADQLESLGSEYVYYHHLARFHELSLGREALPFSEPLFYSRERVENPARVRYDYDPARFSEQIPGTGSAYWVSGMEPRDEGPATIDVTSRGRADQLPTDEVVFRGQYENTIEGYQAEFRGLLRVTPEEFEELWQPAQFQAGWRELNLDVTHNELPPEEVANAFRLTAANLAAATLDSARMELDPSTPITGELSGSGPLALTLTGPFGPATRATVDGQAVPVTVADGGVTVALELAEEPRLLEIIPAPEGDEDTDRPDREEPGTDPPPIDDEDPTDGTSSGGRIFGVGRVETAVELSRAGFASADRAVLARADEFPDALTASTLAAEVDGPVLLTGPDQLDELVAEELDRLGVEEVYLAGGSDALSAEVAEAVQTDDRVATRLGGMDRFGTAALIADEVVAVGGPVDQAILARADQFADALAAGNLAAAGRAPILLTGSDALDQTTEEALDDLLDQGEEVFVAGGQAAVSDDAASSVSAAGYRTTRLAGAERYATGAALVTEAVSQGAGFSTVMLASGTDFPDALAAGPTAHALDGVLLLVDPLDLADSRATQTLLEDNAGDVERLLVAGGVQAVSQAVFDDATALVVPE